MRLARVLRLALPLFMPAAIIAAEPDLTEYRTVEQAIAAKPAKAGGAVATAKTPFLGMSCAADSLGRLSVVEIASDSPAAKAGLKPGDVLVAVDDKIIKSDDELLELVKAKTPGSSMKLRTMRGKETREATLNLASLSNPLTPSRARILLGLEVAPVKNGEGVAIEQVLVGSLAERVKLKVGEVILKVDEVDVGTSEKFGDAFADARFLLALVESGADVVFGDLPTIPEGPVGKFIVTHVAAVAELEAGLISQRTKAALTEAKKRGAILGGANLACRNLDAEAMAKGQRLAAVARSEKADAWYGERDLYSIIAGLHGEGLSLRQIAARLNEDGHTTRRGRPWNPMQVRAVRLRAAKATT
jgi:membrane-associated protease RseP (regulator of RpoE activity)